MLKKIIIILLAAIIIPFSVYAENDSWKCPGCGLSGNTGNFCSNCGTARPNGTWMCQNCGQTGNTGNYCPNCGSPKGDDVPVSTRTLLQQIPGETEKVMVTPTETVSSSHMINKKRPELWIAENATDGNENTCWQFSAKKGLKGKSWIELRFPEGVAVDELWFKNGFWSVNSEGEDQYPVNARIKEVQISVKYENKSDYKDIKKFILKDENRGGWQPVSLDHLENVDTVRIAVLSIYKGSIYPTDVCLTEVMAVQNGSASDALPPAEKEEEAENTPAQEDVGSMLKQKLATRSGPGTTYDEPGTFFTKSWQSQRVKVLKKSSDGNSWWVQIDFRNGAKNSYRVWTGSKRVDVDLDTIQEEMPVGQCDVKPTSDTYYGPGGNYAKANIEISERADGVVYAIENGYADVEYISDDGTQGRVWVPESVIVGLETDKNQSGE